MNAQKPEAKLFRVLQKPWQNNGGDRMDDFAQGQRGEPNDYYNLL